VAENGTALIGGGPPRDYSSPPSSSEGPTTTEDEINLARLDDEYQAAVARNDATTMGQILAEGMILVTGTGKTFTKQNLLEEARSGRFQYDRQDRSRRTIRVWGNTAVVTGVVWAKGKELGKPLEHRCWFSDTYIRTSEGWKYVFGQASLPLTPPPVLAQLNLIASDMAATIAFYRHLGLDIGDDPSTSITDHVVVRMPNGFELEIDDVEFVKQWDPGWENQAGKRPSVLGFSVSSPLAVDELYAKMIQAGYRGLQSPHDAYWGARIAVVEDPDGGPVGIMSPIDLARRSALPSPEAT